MLAVEKNLVLVPRSGHLQPALSFQLLVDSPGQFKGQKGNKVPVEFLSDLKIDFQDCNRLRVITVSQIHTIRNVKFLSKNSILTKLQHFHEFFTKKF